MPKETKPTKNPILMIVIGVFVISLLVVGFVWFRGASESGEYQAVFLTNNQVYFGKVQGAGRDVVILSDVYYLPQSTQLQQGDSASPAEIALIKLGKELHGPTDRMQIIRDNILFFETLSEDSKILKAIQNHKNSN